MTLPNFDDLWDFNKPDETEQKFRELLPQAKQNGDANYHAELLTQLARTLGLQHKFDDAHKVLDCVEPLLAEATPRARVRYLLERGRAFNSAGSKDAARPLFVEAWELGKQSGEDGLAVDAAHMVAIVEAGEDALAWNLKALELAESSPQEKARNWRGSLLNNIGWTYHDQGDYQTALSHFERALEVRKETGKVEPIRIANWCIGRTLRSLGRIEEALSLQQAALREYEADGEKPGYTYEEIGECLLALGREDEARPYFKQAYAALAEDIWLTRDEPERLERLKRLGDGG
jgi:tetratricopeptide (TPR) repeat protein